MYACGQCGFLSLEVFHDSPEGQSTNGCPQISGPGLQEHSTPIFNKPSKSKSLHFCAPQTPKTPVVLQSTLGESQGVSLQR